MDEKSSSVILTELQERLLKDADGSVRAGIDAQLDEWVDELRRGMQGGLGPADFDKFQRLYHGIEAGRAVLKACCQSQVDS